MDLFFNVCSCVQYNFPAWITLSFYSFQSNQNESGEDTSSRVRFEIDNSDDNLLAQNEDHNGIKSINIHHIQGKFLIDPHLSHVKFCYLLMCLIIEALLISSFISRGQLTKSARRCTANKHIQRVYASSYFGHSMCTIRTWTLIKHKVKRHN